MSQEQPRRPQGGGGGGGDNSINQEKPVVLKYGDVFNVSGELALKIIAPGDAALMQIAETTMIGKTFPGGPAEKMLSAAAYNERAGVVDYADVSDVFANQGINIIDQKKNQGINITQTAVPGGGRIISESLGGQMIGQYLKLVPGEGVNHGRDVITIGEALEAAALTVGDKPVNQSDAAAIQAAEIRATGSDVITPGGIAAAAAQSAANANAHLIRDEDKCKLADILTDAAAKLPADKPATQGDAEEVMSAELRNNPNLATHPVGVAEAVVSAARLNQQQGI